MGITGLLPYLKHAITSKPLSTYKNTTIGIDGHSWLYRIAPIIAQELFYQIPTTKHINLFRQKLMVLKSHCIKPILIFDGDRLPSKDVTNSQRAEKKEQTYQMILTCLNNNNVHKAKELMKQCLILTDEILYGILEMLRLENIEYIISPYESDAQLCYLQRIGYIDYIMTEDSDLIVYGCTQILYKFDGNKVDEFRREKMENNVFTSNIIDICILSGCDYLHSIKGIGLLTAIKLMHKFRCYKEVIKNLRGNKNVPNDYEEEFERAKITFLEHIVYDPVLKERIHLSKRKRVDDIKWYQFLGNINIKDEVSHAMGVHIKKKDGLMDKYVTKRKDDNGNRKVKIRKCINSKETIIDENETSNLF